MGECGIRETFQAMKSGQNTKWHRGQTASRAEGVAAYARKAVGLST